MKQGFSGESFNPEIKKNCPDFKQHFLAAACTRPSFKISPASRGETFACDALLQFEMCAEASHSLSIQPRAEEGRRLKSNPLFCECASAAELRCKYARAASGANSSSLSCFFPTPVDSNANFGIALGQKMQDLLRCTLYMWTNKWKITALSFCTNGIGECIYRMKKEKSRWRRNQPHGNSLQYCMRHSK